MRRKVDEYSNLEDISQDSYSKTCLKKKTWSTILKCIKSFLLTTK